MSVYLESVRIQNFLSHKDTAIDFCHGVNAIVGNSKTGKTSILRALEWVYDGSTNPSWEAYQSYWGGDIRVDTRWSNGNEITRGHDKDGNYYMLNGTTLRAFGKGGPPMEVVAALNLNELNFQRQRDKAFLIDNSPGEVAQILNKVVDLSIIDRSISNIKKKKYELDRSQIGAADKIKTLTEQLSVFDYLTNMEKDAVIFETTESKRMRLDDNLRKLRQIALQLRNVLSKSNRLDLILKAEPSLNRVEKQLKQLNSVQNNVKNITVIHERILLGNKAIKKISVFLLAEKDVEAAFAQHKIIQNKRARSKALVAVREQLGSKNRELAAIEKNLAKQTAEFEKKMPDVCPLCGRSSSGRNVY